MRSKEGTESTEFEMQEGQNTSTRIRQPLPPRLWKSFKFGRPVATKEKSRLWLGGSLCEGPAHATKSGVRNPQIENIFMGLSCGVDQCGLN